MNRLKDKEREAFNPEHILRYKSAYDVMGSIRNSILSNTDKLNDFTAGSALETLIEAIATELELFYYLSVTNIKGSIDTAVTSAFNINELPEIKAYGSFIVHFNEPLPNALQLPSGTTFSSSNPEYQQVYQTIDAYDIPAGTTAYSVRAYCTEGGSYGNIPADTINECDNFPQADTVVNPTSISTGQDATSLSELKVRFRNMIQALQRGTVQAVQYGAMETSPLVKGAFVDESVGYVRVYCHDANGELPRPLQKAIQENMVNWRPAGIPVEILPVHRTIVDVGITLDVPNQTLRSPQLLYAVQRKVTNYINSRDASQDLVLNHIVSVVMNMNTMGIDNVQVNLYVRPSNYLLEGETVNSHNSILLNEHIYNKDILAPKDRAEFDDYVHVKSDWDDPPYASNRHGDGYITADIMNDTQDEDGSIDNNLDSNAINPYNNPANQPNLQSDAYLPFMSSISASASNAGVDFNPESASSAFESASAGSLESLVAQGIIDQTSQVDDVQGISYNASEVSSSAFSAVSSFYNNASNASNSSEVKTDANYNIYSELNAQSSAAILGVPAQNNAQVPAAVSAGDAEPNKPMRVLNRYLTRGDEILRAGNVAVDFNDLGQINQ